jgi:hypothetical protein
MKIDYTISNNNKTADIYSRRTHYTIECYNNRIWQTVKIAKTLEEAKTIAKQYTE